MVTGLPAKSRQQELPGTLKATSANLQWRMWARYVTEALRCLLPALFDWDVVDTLSNGRSTGNVGRFTDGATQTLGAGWFFLVGASFAGQTRLWTVNLVVGSSETRHCAHNSMQYAASTSMQVSLTGKHGSGMSHKVKSSKLCLSSSLSSSSSKLNLFVRIQ